ncbi:ferrochelatase [uncultured Jannaschia sp.]|uniref:ferrochelatase n=1 Tax=uncultured Jannaschia sp. TaxID=293347 RepID=UPI002609B45B|nr:ferrochelatase [uncultured Jannaschia sp.]
MKKIALAAVLAATAGTAFAGNIAPAPVEPEPVVIVEDTSSSSTGIIVPILALILLAAAAASD